MFNLINEINKARENKRAIGHFNIANLEMLKAVLEAGQELSQGQDEKIPIIIGLSESERKYFGGKEFVNFIKSIQEDSAYPIFTNADHCQTYESAEKALQVGFDSLVIDNSRMPFQENIEATKRTCSILKSINPEIIIEGEIGFIGASSKLLDQIPEDVKISEETITQVPDAKMFVKETGVDLLSPAVGNLHGVLKNFLNPSLYIDRIKELSEETGTPLVLHGGSGVADEDIREAVEAGIVAVHFSTELRLAYRKGLCDLAEGYFLNHPNELAPYKYMKNVIGEVKQVVSGKLNLIQ